MKERPIIFSGEMVRAILEGRKTQTRRVVKPKLRLSADGADLELHQACPYGQVSDRLWVRESFQVVKPWGSVGDEWIGDDLMEWDGPLPKERPESIGTWDSILYRVDDPETCWWRPSIHMPRWASRILLEIVDVRVEKLQEISEYGAQLEGAPRAKTPGFASHRQGFIDLWNEINGKRGYSWQSNPWVWVIEFKVVSNGT